MQTAALIARESGRRIGCDPDIAIRLRQTSFTISRDWREPVLA
jgi:hypothetical protein